MIPTQQTLFILFVLIIGGFLAIDLGYLNRKAHHIDAKPALYQTIFWVGTAISFCFLVFLYLGREHAAEFMSVYVTEEMLSVDNLFVMLLIFNFFKIEEKFHHKVLFWGIFGAIVFRAVFITAGAFLIHQFEWVLYIFGVVLIYTGAKLFTEKKEEHVDFEKSKVVRAIRKFFPLSSSYHNGKFFIKENGKLHITLLFLIILLIETTDIVFAIDSIPAAFSISQNPFIVFTANIFAVMGLRSLFFLIESVIHKFHHLQKGLSFVLIFIGSKMLLGIVGVHISSLTSFAVIMVALGAAIALSVMDNLRGYPW